MELVSQWHFMRSDQLNGWKSLGGIRKQTRKFGKLLIWNYKKVTEQILVKWMDILARTYLIYHRFYCQQLPGYRKMFSVISVFWNRKIDFIGSILYSKSEKNVVYYSVLGFIIEKKLTVKFLHLFVISSKVRETIFFY